MKFLLIALICIVPLSACRTDEQREPPGPGATERLDERPAPGPGVLDPAPPPSVDDDLPMDAPAFSVETISGEKFDLAARRGEVVLINFWATWCAPCVVEMPDFVKMHEDYGDRGLSILGVSVEEGEEAAVRTFVSDLSINYPIAINVQLADDFGGVYGLPTTFLIDRKGRIVHRIIGLFPTESMLPEIERLLQESA